MRSLEVRIVQILDAEIALNLSLCEPCLRIKLCILWRFHLFVIESMLSGMTNLLERNIYQARCGGGLFEKFISLPQVHC